MRVKLPKKASVQLIKRVEKLKEQEERELSQSRKFDELVNAGFLDDL
jgi:hypothetical protein